MASTAFREEVGHLSEPGRQIVGKAVGKHQRRHLDGLQSRPRVVIPMNLSKELHSLVPGAEFAMAKGGHAFLWEFPGPFNEAVLKFVGKHKG